MQYPLELTFKWSLATSIEVTDSSGQLLFFLRQKMFKLKEIIGVFGDRERNNLKYEIKADRVIDFSARYNFSDTNGRVFGGVKRQGMKSIWKARYDIFGTGDEVKFTLTEKNPWVKVADAFFGEIPIVGMFTGFVFNPTYLISDPSGKLVMSLEKKPSWFSRIFIVKKLDDLMEQEEAEVLLSMLMMILLEKNRG